jgi:cytochrome aa3-600 menaquinol oxidase subunit I
MYISGLDGQARRMFTYSESTGFGFLNMLSFIGAGVMAIAFALIVYNVYYSFRYSPRDIGSDPWDARTLEWATPLHTPEYNFAILPQVNSSEPFWDAKKKNHTLFPGELKPIHMPNNSGLPFIMCCIFFVWGFSFVFAIWTLLIMATIGIFACMAYRSFEKDHGRHISVEEIKETEKHLRGVQQ